MSRLATKEYIRSIAYNSVPVLYISAFNSKTLQQCKVDSEFLHVNPEPMVQTSHNLKACNVYTQGMHM